jgi:hypothetical protein
MSQENLRDFLDMGMLQSFEFARFHYDHLTSVKGKRSGGMVKAGHEPIRTASAASWALPAAEGAVFSSTTKLEDPSRTRLGLAFRARDAQAEPKNPRQNCRKHEQPNDGCNRS